MFSAALDYIEIIVIIAREYGIQAGVAAAFLFFLKSDRFKDKFKRAENAEEAGEEYERKICETISAALQSVLFKLNADRAYLFEFRGYDQQINPIPFSYADNTVEVCNPSSTIRSEKENLQDIPLSTVPFWAQRLSQDRQVCLFNVQDIRDQDPATFQILHNQSIKSVYAVMLVDFRKCPLGFMGVDYCSDLVELGDCQMEQLRSESLKVAGLLALKAKMKDC